ncbi:MAG: alkanesulfonate monooxygenase SsuD [Gammaproteobacteria bacterium]|jgi:alkanesulfonate monooxygenase SsuD/methylene tetrahydromethanopterin reductase-like flavin-dependent oxidoreductase (luciferase family)
MGPKIGYLLPTRENVMKGRPQGKLLLELGKRAASNGYDSLWVGDSLLARPRHEPITLLAALAGCTQNVDLGTAVLLPALRNPVVLAHQVATLDQVSEGRVILGVGIAGDTPGIRAEFAAAGVPFEKRGGRLLEGLQLARALWSGEPVQWDGRWHVVDGVLGPTPHRPGGPPLWYGSSAPLGLIRTAKHFDGWFPTGPGAAEYGERWQDVQRLGKEAGRAPDSVTAAVYLTLSVDDNAERAESSANDYLQSYYGANAAVLRRRQAVYAGGAQGLGEWLQGYVNAGASHLVVRFAGDHERHMDVVSQVRSDLGWSDA